MYYNPFTIMPKLDKKIDVLYHLAIHNMTSAYCSIFLLKKMNLHPYHHNSYSTCLSLQYELYMHAIIFSQSSHNSSLCVGVHGHSACVCFCLYCTCLHQCMNVLCIVFADVFLPVLSLFLSPSLYLYIYIYICVYVCVRERQNKIEGEGERGRENQCDGFNVFVLHFIHWMVVQEQVGVDTDFIGYNANLEQGII